MSALLQSKKMGEHLAGDDLEMMLAVLQRHPTAIDKIGTGVSSIYVGAAEPRGRCFWVQRCDGTVDDFSFNHAVNGEPSDRVKLRSCCRAAVVDSILDFKHQAFFGGTHAVCAETGEALTWRTAHVDHHIIPFVRIADAWLESASDEMKRIAPDEPGIVTGWRFLYNEARASFRSYHDARAHLRLVSPFVNMSKGAR